jgi:hypothetical protein
VPNARQELVTVLAVARRQRRFDLRFRDGEVQALAMVLDRINVDALKRGRLVVPTRAAFLRGRPAAWLARAVDGRERAAFAAALS